MNSHFCSICQTTSNKPFACLEDDPEPLPICLDCFMGYNEMQRAHLCNEIRNARTERIKTKVHHKISEKLSLFVDELVHRMDFIPRDE